MSKVLLTRYIQYNRVCEVVVLVRVLVETRDGLPIQHTCGIDHELADDFGLSRFYDELGFDDGLAVIAYDSVVNDPEQPPWSVDIQHAAC